MHRLCLPVVGILLVVGCDRFPDNGLQVAGMIPFNDDCFVDPNNEARLAGGRWDTQSPEGDPLPRNPEYVITPLLESYLVSRALDVQGEQNNLRITNFEITLQTPDGVDLVLDGGLPNPYTVAASANLPVGVDGEPSRASAIAVAIPSTYRQAVFDAASARGFNQVILVMSAVGTTMGGFTQKSAPLLWPVTLCRPGCLNLCPTQEAANNLTDAQIEELRDACVAGQDTFPYCQFPIPPEEN